MKKTVIGITLVALISSCAIAETSVWKIKKGKSIMYLGGTCHLLRPSDYPLPEEYDKAYKECDILIFETDIGEIQDSATQMKLLAKAVYTDGSTIDSHISADTYQLLDEYCTTNGIPLEALKQFRVSMLVLNLTLMELMKLGITPEGVDKYYYTLAAKDNKTIRGLETVDQQINFIIDMGEGDEDALVTHTLSEIKNTKREFETILDAWKSGDVKNLSKLMVTEIKTKFPKLYKELIVDRNNNWLPVIQDCRKTEEKEFILVGLAHLIGPDGIIAALKKKGYKITKL
jgi:uncharacterized protein YbaP (TraB family)